MEKKITSQYGLVGERILKDTDIERIGKFIKSYHKDFNVDFDKDLQINISIKALPGDGDIKALKITLKDIELQDFDPLQERLSFEMSNQNLVNQ